MKLLNTLLVTMILILFNIQSVDAYSYGDPGEEPLAEAYKELESYVQNDQWDKATQVFHTYTKEFDLYFKQTVPLIEEAFEHKDKELLLTSYQAALRLNIERRLHFADESFDDYGQAKLLLAKARGTFNVLSPKVKEKEGQQVVDDIYQAFDQALVALGNPGLFGIGNKESDYETFIEKKTFIENQLKPLFPVPTGEAGDEHLTEENLDLLDKNNGEQNNTFWLWFTVILFAILIILILLKKRKK